MKPKILAAIVAIIVVYSVITYITTDRSAKRYGDGLFWRDMQYVSAGHFYPTPDQAKFLAEEQAGNALIGCGNDDQHTYISGSSFLDNYFYVRQDYIIQTEGEVTAIAIRDKQLS